MQRNIINTLEVFKQQDRSEMVMPEVGSFDLAQNAECFGTWRLSARAFILHHLVKPRKLVK
jgi:hypothetical protein